MSIELQSVIYAVSVRSENWKLNLLLNLRLSVVYGNEGKIRGFEVWEVGCTLWKDESFCVISEFVMYTWCSENWWKGAVLSSYCKE